MCSVTVTPPPLAQTTDAHLPQKTDGKKDRTDWTEVNAAGATVAYCISVTTVHTRLFPSFAFLPILNYALQDCFPFFVGKRQTEENIKSCNNDEKVETIASNRGGE